MYNKVLLFIIGITTSGKTTLSNILVTARGIHNFFPVAQIIGRKKRHDDKDTELQKFVSPEDYRKTMLLCSNGPYGIELRSFNNFLKSTNRFGVVIGNTENLNNLIALQNDKFKLVSIMLTISETKENELIELEKQLSKYFEPNILKSRLHMQQNLIEQYFYNDKYRQRIDLHFIKQKQSLKDYLLKINEYIEINYKYKIISDLLILENDINEISYRINKERELK